MASIIRNLLIATARLLAMMETIHNPDMFYDDFTFYGDAVTLPPHEYIVIKYFRKTTAEHNAVTDAPYVVTTPKMEYVGE